MKIKELRKRSELQNSTTFNDAYNHFVKFINELRLKDLPDTTIEFLNKNIEELNSFENSDKKFRSLLRKKQGEISRYLEKNHKIVAKNYYRNIWIALGMTAFGIPIGVGVSLKTGNMAFIGLGLPLGLLLGSLVGAQLDKKTFKEGRQLATELKSF